MLRPLRVRAACSDHQLPRNTNTSQLAPSRRPRESVGTTEAPPPVRLSEGGAARELFERNASHSTPGVFLLSLLNYSGMVLRSNTVDFVLSSFGDHESATGRCSSCVVFPPITSPACGQTAGMPRGSFLPFFCAWDSPPSSLLYLGAYYLGFGWVRNPRSILLAPRSNSGITPVGLLERYEDTSSPPSHRPVGCCGSQSGSQKITTHSTRFEIFFAGCGYVTTQDGTSRSESRGLRRSGIERSAHGHCSAPSHPCRALG